MTQAFNLAQLANNLNTSGQLDATDGLTGATPVANGGTGRTTLTANNVVLGNGTSSVNFVAPGTSGNILTSNGTTWQSSAAPTGITATSGSAPYYAARAWLLYDGELQQIRDSRNVSSVTYVGTGEYVMNFTTAMPDANFAAAVTASGPVSQYHVVPFYGNPGSNDTSGFNTSSFKWSHYNTTASSQRANPARVGVIIMR